MDIRRSFFIPLAGLAGAALAGLLVLVGPMVKAGPREGRASAPEYLVRQTARPTVRALVVVLADGRTRVIQGAELEDPRGGVLVWNDFGVEVLRTYYTAVGETAKAEAAQRRWNGLNADGTSTGTLPALLTKPTCDPDPWP